MKIQLNGVFLNIPTGTPDCNGRIYDKDMMEKAILEYSRKIEKLKLKKDRTDKLNKINKK